jgi:predicted metal-dependent phosphoesterase TrpH
MTRRFDLHVHSYHSKDACNPPDELVSAALAKGLCGIAITDHDNCDAHLQPHPISAPEGFLVVPGVEVSTAEGHLLCIGTTLPRLKGRPAKDVVEAIHAAGGIAIPAHPFDSWRAGIRPSVLDSLDIDALEVFNAAVSSPKFNELAFAYAKSRGLSMTASSDAHHASAVGTASTSFDLDELSLPALLAAIRRGGTPEGRYLTTREALRKHFGNWFRIFNKRPNPLP